MFVSKNASMSSFPTQKSKYFGIPFTNDPRMIDHQRSYSLGKRKIRNEYKTKKTTFQRDIGEEV